MSNDIRKVFVGYDSREDIAYKVCEYSIYKHSPGAEVIPLKQADLRRDGLYGRPEDPLSSTEFTFTRFLVPYLSNYSGWALFCDCDFVWDGSIEEIFEKADPKYAVMVVQHDHKPNNTTKMDGKQQTQYPRKNWSSMILWNCEHPSNQQLNPELINKTTGQFLHRFEWLSDHEIGKLDFRYNFLVGWNDPNSVKPVAYHWTEGGPWFPEYVNCPFNNVWIKYLLEYADEIGKDHVMQRTPITWVTSLSRSYYDEVAQHTMPSWSNLPGDIVVVWDDKPLDIGIGKIFNFWKDVASPEDPWLKEGMGGTKADRFWKKSRVQVWATRKFKGLVVWIDADIQITQPLSRSKAIEMLHPGDKIWGTLDCGEDHPQVYDHIDTGIVSFNTKHNSFQDFIREYSLMWYNGQIYQCRQPYDHYAVTLLSKRWPVKTFVPNWKTWKNIQNDFPNRFNMENSFLSEYMTHHLGIENKEILSKEKKKKNK
jgi:hypothetical protein